MTRLKVVSIAHVRRDAERIMAYCDVLTEFADTLIYVNYSYFANNRVIIYTKSVTFIKKKTTYLCSTINYA